MRSPSEAGARRSGAMASLLAGRTKIPANENERKHQQIDRLRAFRRLVLLTAPELDDARFAPLLFSFARTSVLTVAVWEHLTKRGLVDDEGELRHASVDTLRKLIHTQLMLAQCLRLSPAALGKMKNEKAVDLVEVMGRAAEEDDAEDDGSADH
jgi:hypothetical protein